MTMMRKTCTAAVVLSMLGVSACTTTGNGGGYGVKEQAATVGVIAGGVLGALIGGSSGRALGAVIGAAAGGALGYAIGASLEERKAQYASDEAFYDAQIAQSRDLNTQLSQNNAQLAGEVATLRADTDALLVAYKQSKADKAKLASHKNELDERVSKFEGQLAQLEEEAAVQRQVVTEARGAGDAVRSQALEAEVQTLEAEIAQLRGLVDGMGQQSAAIGQYL